MIEATTEKTERNTETEVVKNVIQEKVKPR